MIQSAWILYPLIKQLLFMLEPERAHNVSLKGLNLLYGREPNDPIVSQPQTLMGLNFKNPVGLAAGFDKNANYIHSLSRMGFGSIEIGTVTPKPQKGNLRPRIFRLEKDEAIINRMGFNNDGMICIAQRLANCDYSGILGVNIGKNKDTPIEIASTDYIACMEYLAAYADYFVINISSPNTPELRKLQDISHLEGLVKQLKNVQKKLRNMYAKPLPLVIKLAPDCSAEEQVERLQLIKSEGVEGVIMTNTTSGRRDLSDKHMNEKGGLSGAPLFEISTGMLRLAKKTLQDDVTLIASGGVMSPDDAQEKIESGASLVQLYTGLVYRGPILVTEILQKLNC